MTCCRSFGLVASLAMALLTAVGCGDEAPASESESAICDADCPAGDTAAATDAPTIGGDGGSSSADGADLPPPPEFTVVLPVAPPNLTFTEAQRAEHAKKRAEKQDYNEMYMKADVVVASPEAAAKAVLTDTAITVPLAGNEALLALTPGAPLVGQPADAGATAAGESNNYFGFLRRVKSVRQEGPSIIVETERATMDDVLVGSMSMHFPEYMKEIEVPDTVDIDTLVPVLAPALPDDVPTAPSVWDEAPALKPGTQQSALKVGVGFDQSFKVDLLDMDTTVTLGDVDLTIKASGWLDTNVSFNAAAIFDLDINIFSSNYLYAGFQANASARVKYDIDAEVTAKVKASAGPDDEKKKKGLGLEKLSKTPQGKKKPKFRLGQPRYYSGPAIGPIPTVFVFALEAECSFAVKGKLKAHGLAGLGFNAEFGVKYEDYDWSTVADTGFDHPWEIVIDEAGGGVEATCQIGPKLSWMFAGVAGPYVAINLGIKAEASYASTCRSMSITPFNSPPQGQIDAGLELFVNPELGVAIDLFIWSTSFSKELCDFESDDLEDICEYLKWPLWSEEWYVPGLTAEPVCPGHCENDVKDAGEADVDCGGEDPDNACDACPPGSACKVDVDCGVPPAVECVGGKCIQYECTNGVKDYYETDVDCGNKCSPLGRTCLLHGKCKIDTDCASGKCSLNCKVVGGKQVCDTLTLGQCGTPKCDNGAKDYWESGVDCGGKYCPKCGAAAECKSTADCLPSLTCDAESGRCGIPGCNIMSFLEEPYVKHFGMTDVMCGGVCAKADIGPAICRTDSKGNQVCGPAVVKCAAGKACDVDTDCLSGTCADGVCQSCKDGIKNGTETDVDCGGKCNAKCGWDKACNSDQDCNPGNFCVTEKGGWKSVCSPCKNDGQKNGQESTEDCGQVCKTASTNVSGCRISQPCADNYQCKTSYSDIVDNKSVWIAVSYCRDGACTPPCYNGVSDPGYDTDLDCGGACANVKKCAIDQHCLKNSDCVTDVCLGQKCFSRCYSGTKDADEAGVDCGGVCAGKCNKGQTCNTGDDCKSGMCIKGVCGFDACLDNKVSPGEADVDCGGPCANKCALNASCKVDKDCASAHCDGQKCVATACEDQRKTPGEADVDCGGSCASATCADGSTCKSGPDCTSGVCSAKGRCVATSCFDVRKSSGETDVDCGGACTKNCVTNQGCTSGSDCDSGWCNSTVCVADSCEDRALSAGESDVDCGGVCMTKCATGKVCATGLDCMSGVCSVNGRCVSSACDDGRKSPAETDVDCGGPCATPCLLGKTCSADGDCQSSLCAMNTKRCVGTTCEDGRKSGDESDADCGGGCAIKCDDAGACSLPSDCSSVVCISGHCVGGHCDNGVEDQGETGVDCGGTCSGTCAVGVDCKENTDCTSGWCDGVKCVASQCEDNVIDAGETGPDCGGLCRSTTLCALGLGCEEGGDCLSGVCATTSRVCVTSTCKDEVVSPGESDVDCGGSCTACPVGRTCSLNTDCSSTYCDGTHCVADHCSDQQKDVDEVDVDCGGACEKCGIAATCTSVDDCASGVCSATSHRCVATECEDEALSDGETGVDCGGPTCATRCEVGSSCIVDSDCDSGICATNTNTCVATACENQRLDSGETEVDCGGSCGGCPDGTPCSQDDQCLAGLCAPAPHRCSYPVWPYETQAPEPCWTTADCRGGSAQNVPTCSGAPLAPRTCGCPAGLMAVRVSTGGQTVTRCAWQRARALGIKTVKFNLNGDLGATVAHVENNLEFIIGVVDAQGALAGPAPATAMAYEAAFQSCDNLVYGGHDDWRLPSLGEVASSLREEVEPVTCKGRVTLPFGSIPEPSDIWTLDSFKDPNLVTPPDALARYTVTASPVRVRVSWTVDGTASAWCVRSTEEHDWALRTATYPPVGPPVSPLYSVDIAMGLFQNDQTSPKLAWKPSEVSGLTSAQAIDYCNNLPLSPPPVPPNNTNGFQQRALVWHVPSASTLMSAIDTRRSGPFWDDLFGEAGPTDRYFGTIDVMTAANLTAIACSPDKVLPLELNPAVNELNRSYLTETTQDASTFTVKCASIVTTTPQCSNDAQCGAGYWCKPAAIGSTIGFCTARVVSAVFCSEHPSMCMEGLTCGADGQCH